MPRLRHLPTSVRASELLSAAAVGISAGGRQAWLGLGGDEATPCGLDLDADPVAVISGPTGSGRTTALRTIATSLAAAGTSVVTISPRTDGELTGAWSCCRSDGRDALTRLVADYPRTCVLVDDAELVADTAVEPVLLELARRRGPTALVIAGDAAALLNAFRGVAAAARSARTGLLLQPARPSDGEVLGVRVQVPDERPPGRGVLVVRGRQQPVQVAR
jgi:DNA segregation ATPase FtsK/SpoIIIE, S-DNA-T family